MLVLLIVQSMKCTRTVELNYSRTVCHAVSHAEAENQRGQKIDEHLSITKQESIHHQARRVMTYFDRQSTDERKEPFYDFYSFKVHPKFFSASESKKCHYLTISFNSTFFQQRFHDEVLGFICKTGHLSA